MATVSKSLNSLYKKAMHRPMTIDGFALYTKADGYSGTVEGESQAEQSEHYRKHCNSTYNSPTNIRKVFITGKGVAVQYYAKPISANNNGTHWSFSTFDEHFNLFDTAFKMLTYQSDLAKYNMSKATGMKCEEPKRYKIDGNGIGIISHPWVCSNIEEIYFDWTMLMSAEVAPYFKDFCTASAYQAFISKEEPVIEQNYSGIQSFFEMFNMGGTRNIRKRFPRLRFIAMISRLQDILDNTQLTRKIDLVFRNLEESKHTWYEVNRSAIEQSGSTVLYCDLSNTLQFPNKEFIVKAYQYKFDFDELDGIIKAYIVKINDIVRAKYGSIAENNEAEAEDSEDFEYNEIEKRCIEIQQTSGDNVLKNSVLFALKGSGIKVSEFKNIVEQFSKPNRLKIAKMVGLKDIN